MAIEKSKKAASLLSDLHFTTSLSLEACAHRITQINQPEILVHVKLLNSDIIAFELERVREGMPNPRVRGVLRRWQGTLTRLDCDEDLQTPGIFTEMLQHLWTWFIAVIIILGICGFWAMGVSAPGDFENVFLWIEWFWWNNWHYISLISIAVAWFLVNRGVNRRIQQGNVDVDRLLQWIMRVFADADITQVERDTMRLTENASISETWSEQLASQSDNEQQTKS